MMRPAIMTLMRWLQLFGRELVVAAAEFGDRVGRAERIGIGGLAEGFDLLEFCLAKSEEFSLKI